MNETVFNGIKLKECSLSLATTEPKHYTANRVRVFFAAAAVAVAVSVTVCTQLNKQIDEERLTIEKERQEQ